MLSIHTIPRFFRCSGQARDHKIFGTIHRSLDSGKTYREYLYTDHPDTYCCSTVATPSRFRHSFILYAETNIGTRQSAILFTPDDGDTRTFLWHLPQGLFVQAMREDYVTPGAIYAFIDGLKYIRG